MTQNTSYQAVAVAMATHPDLDHGDESGWHDFECTIPADFSGEFNYEDSSTSVFFDYQIYDDNIEMLTIEQEFDLDSVAVILSYHNGIEQIGYSVNKAENELSVRYDGKRIMSFVAKVGDRTIEFKRDMSHEEGIAPIFVPA
jgi:hypothetical protein